MYFELDLDYQAMLTIGYIALTFIIMKGVVALFKNNDKGKKGKKQETTMTIKIDNLTPEVSHLKLKRITDVYGKVLVVKGWQ